MHNQFSIFQQFLVFNLILLVLLGHAENGCLLRPTRLTVVLKYNWENVLLASGQTSFFVSLGVTSMAATLPIAE